MQTTDARVIAIRARGRALPVLLLATVVAVLALVALPGLQGAAAAAPACGVLEPGGSAAAETMVKDACTKIGVAYSWGGGHGASPGETYGLCDPSNGAPNDCHVKGFDCSGLTRWAFFAAVGGDDLNGTAQGQLNALNGRGLADIPVDQVKAGDLLFYGGAGSIHHVAIALGGGYVVEAPNSGALVRVGTSYGGHSDLFAAKRPL